MDGEIFFTDSVYEPIEEDHGLDINHEADFNPTPSEQSKKAAAKKPTKDYSNQKKVTQKIRQFIDEDDLIRISKTIKKPKPGQLSSGVRRMKNDVVAISKIAPDIQNTIIGSSRLKVSDKIKLEQLRNVSTSVEKETDTLLSPLMICSAETDLFALRAPGYDIETPLGNTQCDIKQSKVYKKTMELAEIDTVIQKLDTSILDLKMDSLRSFNHQNSIKDQLDFEEPKDEEETCARIRPLLKVVRRPLVEVNLMNKPGTSYHHDDHPVSSLAAVHSDISGEYSLYGDIRPEILIQEEMARRGYQHCADYLSRIAAMAEGFERNKKAVDNENDPISKKKSYRKNELTEKGDETIKMVIKRIPKGDYANQEATYEISKKEEPNEPKKKKLAPRKKSIEGNNIPSNFKRPASSKLQNDAIPKKKAKLCFDMSSSSTKSWTRF